MIPPSHFHVSSVEKLCLFFGGFFSRSRIDFQKNWMRNIKNKRHTLTCGGCSVHQKYKARLECARPEATFGGGSTCSTDRTAPGPSGENYSGTAPSLSLVVRSRSLELAMSQTQRKTQISIATSLLVTPVANVARIPRSKKKKKKKNAGWNFQGGCRATWKPVLERAWILQKFSQTLPHSNSLNGR